tara:strand:+ start:492 stop:1445 length:954 start_codon:yes stop_codon:yes gene_type:complete
MKNKILVTGGSGFLGSHLCKKLLLDERNYLLCLDNLFTGNKNNVKSFLDNSNFEFIKHDVTSPIELDGINQIYNLACPASPIHYQSNPVQTIKTNVHGAINMLNLAKNNNATILQASTSEVYGDPEVHPQKESYWGRVNPIGIRACYDEGKRCAETIFFDYHRQYKLNIKVMRIFNTYGPNMSLDDGRVVSNFIIQALRGEDITIYGNGLQSRSFCYVDDLVDGMIKLMDSRNDFIGPVNIGNPNEFTILELAKKIINLTNSSSQLINKPLPEDDPIQRKPDIKLATQKLQWEPRIELEEGLQNTIIYFENMLTEAI